MARRLALLSFTLLLILAAPAGAHPDLAPDHRDTRDELGGVAIAPAVRAVEAAAGTAGEGLPREWCGTERNSDDVDNAVYSPELPQFKVVYAYSAERSNRFAAWQDAIQADVSLIGSFMGAQSGGRTTPRFDLGTACGAEYVDVQVVEVPGARSDYVDDFPALRAKVREQIPTVAGRPRNVMIFADGFSSRPPGHWWGQGTQTLDDRPDAANRANSGELNAVLWIPDGEPAPDAEWWPEGMLHEMTHNLGGVQNSAPNSTGALHCVDGFDVMCYDDGGPIEYSPGACSKVAGVMNQVYDCGNDDYFNVEPATGSYLATHWNVYDNVFLGTCTDLAPACGAQGGSIPKPPVSTAPPRVEGSARVGARLVAATGSWTNSPQALHVAWERGDGDAWSQIRGATGTTYDVPAYDAGLRLRVRVIAGNADGSTAAYSAPTGLVAPRNSGGGATAAFPPPPPAAQPGAPPPAAVPSTASGRRTARAALRVARGRGRGKRIATIAFSVADGRLKAARARLRLPKGRYTAALCSTATVPRCIRIGLTARRGRRATVPALKLAGLPGRAGSVTYTVRKRGSRFSARTRAIRLRG